MESRSSEVEDAIATELRFSEDDGSDDVDDDIDYMKREMQYVLGFGYESSPTSRDCHTISVIFCHLRNPSFLAFIDNICMQQLR
jgi:hypothetical protein